MIRSEDTGQPPTQIPRLAEVTVYGNKTSSNKTLYVPITFNDIKVDAVVDTAAQVTVISSGTFNKLRPKPKVKGNVCLRGVGNGSEIFGEIVEVNLTMGNNNIKWNVIVADISDSVLLGIDFLDHHQISIDLNTYCLKMKNEYLESVSISTEKKQHSKNTPRSCHKQ